MTDNSVLTDEVRADLKAKAEKAVYGDPADVEPWVCIGCGADSPRKIRPCDCPSQLVFVRGFPRRNAEQRIDPEADMPVRAKFVLSLLAALEEAEGDRDRQKARADAHEKLVYRDRVWRCDACELRTAGSGGLCLNGCAGAVFPVTWRAECRSAEALLEEATARAEKAEQQRDGLLDVVARVRVMFRLDLRKMLEFGKHYNQAVKDVHDAVEAALSEEER